MARRIITAREQVEMLSPWRTAADQKPTTLYRGMRVNLPPELVAEMREKLAAPRTVEEAGRELDLGPKILQHLVSTPWQTAIRGGHAPWTGLGPNWHPNPKKAHEAAYGYYDAAQQGTPWSDGNRADWPLIMTAETEHPGEADPRTDHLAGEVHFPQGHPLKITSLVLQPEIGPDGTLHRRVANGGTSVELLHNPIYERHGIHPGGHRIFTATMFPWRAARLKTAADLAKEYTQQLHDEFHDWAGQKGNLPISFDNGWDYTKPMGGPLTYWDNIEGFFKDRYPEAYRGFNMAEEKARPLMDNGRATWSAETMRAKPYETGPEAEAKYGYDPKALAAGMMYLHTWSHAQSAQNAWRGDKLPRDIGRLNDIFQKRQQMQRNYEQNQAVTNA